MLGIKYNNVATVRLRGKKQAARFAAIIAKQPVTNKCKVLQSGCNISLLVPQDWDKDAQLVRMYTFRQLANLYQISERNQQTRKVRQALKDVLESFAPLLASDDSEARHHAADLLLCTALEALGQKAIVAAWRKVGKRYA